ncbi:MAG: AIR synthase related protein [bacterium]|nr:AIR synthase related protein [bacterium]
MADLDQATGVDYDVLDAFKRQALGAATHTENLPELAKLGVIPIAASRGESAYLLRVGDLHIAHVQECLGTKMLVADEMTRIADSLKYFLRDMWGGGLGIQGYKARWYKNISQDAVAMIVNDMIAVGALPISVGMYLAVGDAAWLADDMRSYGLVNGWRLACKEAGCAYGPGETPELGVVVRPGTADLAGSGVGLIAPGREPWLPERIAEGDSIIFCESSGIHANGLTKAREIADALPDGYLTEVPGSGGRCYGDVLLDPTHIYVPLIREAISWNGARHGVNMTGHGLRKLMRAPQSWTYVIDTLPTERAIFPFIQTRGGFSLEQMYCAYNMGAGFALIVSGFESFLELVSRKTWPYRIFAAGHVEKGPKRVVIEPLGLTLPGDSLNIR